MTEKENVASGVAWVLLGLSTSHFGEQIQICPLLLIQLSANVLWKASSAWAPATHLGAWMDFQAPGFVLA